MCFFVSYGASQQRPCVRIGLTHAYLSHVKMTLANAKSVNRQTLENVVRNAASEFTRRTAIASLASLRPRPLDGTIPLPQAMTCQFKFFWAPKWQLLLNDHYLAYLCRSHLELQQPFLAAWFACQFSSTITSVICPSSKLRGILPLPLPVLVQHPNELLQWLVK